MWEIFETDPKSTSSLPSCRLVLMLFKLVVFFFGAKVWAKKNEFMNWAACKFSYFVQFEKHLDSPQVDLTM